MNIIDVKTVQKDYQVKLGYGILSELNEVIDANRPILVITDDYVKQLHYKELVEYLPSQHEVISFSNPPEQSKTLNGYQHILEFAYKKHYPRGLQVIAFGGGAIGDLAGYFAATYKRGVSFIQVPTTILAHDSSVGGKVAINFKDVKNMVGAFYQPDCVIYELSFLDTLNEAEQRSGFSEAVKHSMLSKEPFLITIMNTITSMDQLVLERQKLLKLITDCIEVKNYYVLEDVYDTSVRQFLNFGHTLAHGLEKQYELTHGEAVAFGMCFDLFLSKTTRDEGVNFLDLYSYFFRLGYFRDLNTIDAKKLYKVMRHDKKNRDENLVFIGLKNLGEPYKIEISKDLFFQKMKEFLINIKNLVI
ncbi:3-dehydroquinate synthase [Haloplasma contractile]|uniref:3-dehydroquinate synthase protein n=1 Tax=Haloplasma contractile SSD-17B TaxID=1033810 RepID=F7Q177_9MOLU|nr:3-dehydroquinate synthase family protein [Haloplasma contractile]ERJ12794.1 3-dehydroquinate synthase protein [Haloplasma contractile SSD-17B]